MEAFINETSIILVLLLLIAGIVFLIKGADVFVEGSSGIARMFNVPSLIIGMTVVSIGTSLPEFSVSLIASISGKNELAISNVTGSDIFNILVVLGACALISPVHVENNTVKRDIPFLLIASIVLVSPFFIELITRSGNMEVNRVVGAILAAMFIYYMVSMVLRGKKGGDEDAENENGKESSLIKSILFIVLGAAGVIIGGDVTVDCASRIATDLGMSQTLVGLTIVSVGTSLPELVTSIVAIKKGELGMALGNSIGSCIFNILMIAGFASLISPITLTMDNVLDLFIMIGTFLIAWVFAVTRKTISRMEGSVLLFLYAVYLVYIIIR